jgi:hypothetical protein
VFADEPLLPGWHACPNCQSEDHYNPNDPTGKNCSFCLGDTIVAEGRYQQYRSVMESFHRARWIGGPG